MGERVCVRCGRRIEWRKKWAAIWEEIKYCSQACRRRKLREVDHQTERILLKLLLESGSSKAICPSEALRDMSTHGSGYLPLEVARMAARRLVAKGDAEITQNGRVVDPSTAKGAMRIRLKK